MKKKSQKEGTFNTPSERHPVAKLDPETVKKISGVRKQNDPIQAKNAEIAKEKSKGKKLVDQYFQEQETGPLEFVSRAVKEHFNLTQVIYKEKLIRWDFPKTIGSTWEKHVVERLYPQVKIYIDAFNAKDPQEEIDRIKSCMEALGLQYTYVKGGEPYADKDGHITDEFKKLIFVKRLAAIDPKTLKTPLKVPKTPEEAGHRPLIVQA